MAFLKLTPLQSRFAATFAATLFVFAFYYILSTNSGSFAYALDEVDQIIARYAGAGASAENPVVIIAEQEGDKEEQTEDNKTEDESTEAQHDDYILPRALTDPTSLGNNQYQMLNIELGETQYWVFPKDSVLGAHAPTPKGLPSNVTDTNSTDSALSSDEVNRYELRKRSSDVYISLTTCLKPSLNTSNSNATADTQLPR